MDIHYPLFGDFTTQKISILCNAERLHKRVLQVFKRTRKKHDRFRKEKMLPLTPKEINSYKEAMILMTNLSVLRKIVKSIRPFPSQLKKKLWKSIKKEIKPPKLNHIE